MTNQPAPQPETARAPWVDGDPLMEAIAAAVWEHCETGDGGIVHDDPRNIAAAAAAAVRAQTPTADRATDTCTHCGKPIRRITGTLAAWWVHTPGGNTVCHPEHAAASTRAEPAEDGAQP